MSGRGGGEGGWERRLIISCNEVRQFCVTSGCEVTLSNIISMAQYYHAELTRIEQLCTGLPCTYHEEREGNLDSEFYLSITILISSQIKPIHAMSHCC